MKLRVIFFLSVGLLAASLSYSVVRAEQAAAPAGDAKSIWDGVFTAEQAERGAEAYKTSCSECHGGDLMGDGFAPALSGADFQGNWNDL